MDESILSLIKQRLTFRQAGEYLKKPIFDIDIRNNAKIFNHIDSSSDSDDLSEISNILIDKNDKPERILTLKDYKRKLKALGSHFKYTDTFTDCYKAAMMETKTENEDPNDDLSNEIESVQQIIKDILEQDTNYHDMHYENNLVTALDDDKLIPNLSEFILSEDEKESEEESSTYWKLLEESGDKGVTSQNNSDYIFEKTHWLDRPPISWEVIDAAVTKCENWLKKYFKSK